MPLKPILVTDVKKIREPRKCRRKCVPFCTPIFDPIITTVYNGKPGERLEISITWTEVVQGCWGCFFTKLCSFNVRGSTMSRSFLVDSLIKKDSKPKRAASPVDFLPQRFSYSTTFADYLLAMGRMPSDKKSDCLRAVNSGVIAGAKFDSSSLHPSDFRFPNYYPKYPYQPMCCGVDLSNHPPAGFKSKIFRPIPLPTSRNGDEEKIDRNHQSSDASEFKSTLHGKLDKFLEWALLQIQNY